MLDALTLQFLRDYPDEAAIVLSQVPTEHCLKLLEKIPEEIRGVVISYMQGGFIRYYAEHHTQSSMAKLLNHLDINVCVRMLVQLPRDKQSSIISMLTKDRQTKMAAQLYYAPDQVGSWANPDIQSFSAHMTVKAAKRILKTQHPHVLHVIYIIDNDFKLVGFINTKQLLLEPNERLLSDFMERGVITLPAQSKLSQAHKHAAWRYINHLPVVNQAHQFIGVLSFKQLQPNLDTQPKWMPVILESLITVSQLGLHTIDAILQSHKKGKKHVR